LARTFRRSRDWTTRSPFLSAISTSTVWVGIGRRFSTIFSATGPPTRSIRTSISYARANPGDGAARKGNSKWRRLTEERAGRAKSVFHFDAPGSVAKATHAGLPWLRALRQQLGGKVHFWPFDGWTIPEGRSAVAEIYPSLWNKRYPPEDRNSHQQDAYCVAAWMAEEDCSGRLGAYLHPDLSEPERAVAAIEGWILGVP
jgi:hypothetical protein